MNLPIVPTLPHLERFYKKPSNERTLRTNCRGFEYFVSRPLVAGNSKLDKNVLIFDIPAIYTCHNCRSCKDTCYAMKAQRMYPNTRAKRFANYYMFLFDTVNLYLAIDTQLTKSNKPFVRIHSSGDFFSQEYIDFWTRIIIHHPNKAFYFYTKVDQIFDFSEMLSLPNVNMVKSILPNGHINYAPREEIIPMARELKIPLCPYGLDKNKEPVHCGGQCSICMHKPYVAFIQH